MRQGINPAKRGTIRPHRYGRLGVISLVYIPTLQGFFEHSLDVLRWHLASLRKTLPEDGEIVVWDNGSCAEVRAFLVQRYEEREIDYLFLSHYNVGKTGALNWLLAALPHPFIGYSDGDVYFFRGWWEETERIFRVFPKAGMVSAQPAFFDVLRGQSRMPSLVEEAEDCTLDTIVPEPQDYALYLRGLGYAPSGEGVPRLPAVRCAEDYAFLGATHMQFVMRRDVARQVVPLPVRYTLNREDDRELHRRVEEAGYWQLSSPRLYVYHMGNRPWFPRGREETLPQAATLEEAGSKVPFSWRRRMLRQIQRLVRAWPFLSRFLERIYHLSFKVLYEEE